MLFSTKPVRSNAQVSPCSQKRDIALASSSSAHRLILGLAVVLGATQFALAQDDWTHLAERTRPAIVVIQTDAAQGSGFIVAADGTILTNYHVVEDATSILIALESGEVYRRAYVISVDASRDIALLRIEGAELPHLVLANSNDVRVGERVLLIGAPRGLDFTISEGLVSAVRVVNGSRVIQTTAAASSGSSGGPLLNASGEVIGIMTFSRIDGQNLNFAIPINYAKGMLSTERLSAPAALLSANDAVVSSPASDTLAPATYLGGFGGTSFRRIAVNLMNHLNSLGVVVANPDIAVRPESAAELPVQYYLDQARSSHADFLLHLEVDIAWGNFRDSATIRCYELDTGSLAWQRRVTDIAASFEGAENDLSRDLASRLDALTGEPCVVAQGR